MKIGIVLSGGASKSIAHLGVIKALTDFGVKIDAISASSGGAILGSLIACGLSPEEVMNVIVQKANFNFYFPSFRKGGLFTMSRLEAVYEEHLPVRTFEELNIPLIVVATNVSKGEAVYFSKGDLLKPVIASGSYPVVFEPVEIDGEFYLDGGITNNFPVEPLKKIVDKTIGVSVGKVYPIDKINSVKRVVFRSLELAINEGDKARFGLCDCFIEPQGLNEFGMFDFEEAPKLFKLGYDYAKSKEIEIIRKLEI